MVRMHLHTKKCRKAKTNTIWYELTHRGMLRRQVEKTTPILYNKTNTVVKVQTYEKRFQAKTYKKSKMKRPILYDKKYHIQRIVEK